MQSEVSVVELEWRKFGEVERRCTDKSATLNWKYAELGSPYLSLWIDDKILILQLWFDPGYDPSKDAEVLVSFEQLARIRYGLED